MSANTHKTGKTYVLVDPGAGAIRGIRCRRKEDGSVEIVKVDQHPSDAIDHGRIYRKARFDHTLRGLAGDADAVTVVLATPSMRVENIVPNPTEFGASQEIGEDHMAELKRRARHALRKKYEGYEVLSVTPVAYWVDGHPQETSPIGAFAQKLGVEFTGVLLPRNEYSLYHSALGMLPAPEKKIKDFGTAYQQFLTDEEQREGVAVVDIGYHLTKVAIYKGEGLAYLQVIPLGGADIVRDIARAFTIPSQKARKLMEKEGGAARVVSPRVFVIQDPSNPEKTWKVSEEQLTTVIEHRLEDILDVVKTALSNSEVGVLPYGIYLAGGVASLRNIVEKAREVLNDSVQVISLKSALKVALEQMEMQHQMLSFALLDAQMEALSSWNPAPQAAELPSPRSGPTDPDEEETVVEAVREKGKGKASLLGKVQKWLKEIFLGYEGVPENQ